MGWLILLVLAVLAGAAWLASLQVRPWRPCRTCRGSGKLYGPLSRSSFGTCRSCGGKGRHPRLAIRILQPARHRRLREDEPDHKSVDRRK